jgi:hypothetical protein
MIFNAQQPTSNAQFSTWKLDVERWLLDVDFSSLVVGCWLLGVRIKASGQAA